MSDKTKSTKKMQSAGKLTVEAITNITDIVEAIHSKILSFGGVINMPENNKTKGITGMVYTNIRYITQLAGEAIDTLLDKLNLIVSDKEPTLGQLSVISAINGVLGDYLEEKKNPLAIQMQFLYKNEVVNEDELSKILEKSGGKLAILLHGSCMNYLQWNRQEHDHGQALYSDLGVIPVYLYYNTGLHISENGKQLSQLLEKMLTKLPSSTEIFFIAHSMGGLLSRSSCYYAEKNQHKWLKNLKKIVFLGTPHHGAPLEKIGNWMDTVLDSNPYSEPLSRLVKIRSAGITDLRYGNIIKDDWQGRDRFQPAGDQRIPVALPVNVECYTVAASITKEANMIGDDLVGDGLVPVNSALGIHLKPEFMLNFPQSNQFICRQTKHLDLLNSLEVYKKIKIWLQ